MKSLKIPRMGETLPTKLHYTLQVSFAKTKSTIETAKKQTEQTFLTTDLENLDT